MSSLKPEALLFPLALLWVADAVGVGLSPWVGGLTGLVLGVLTWLHLRRGVFLGPPLLILSGLVLWAFFFRFVSASSLGRRKFFRCCRDPGAPFGIGYHFPLGTLVA